MAATKEGYPPSDFLVVEDPEKATTFHLQVKRHGKPDHGLMGAAFAALYKNYRGNAYEGPGKEEAQRKLRALYKSEGLDWPETNSEVKSMKDKVRTENSDFILHTSAFPRFVALLADVPGTGLIRIPIAVTGTWGGAEKKFSIELEDLEQIRENFAQKPTGEINVDYEHASEVAFGTGGPVLSAGRITKLDEPERFSNGNREWGMGNRETPNSQLPTPNSRFILWGWYEPTERARQLIAHREYRYISPAIRWGAKDKVTGKTAGTVLTSVALVNKPFLEELPEIHLCEMQDSARRGGRIQDSGEAPDRVFVSLQQLHVPGPVNQVSVAYQQPGMDSAGRSKGSGPESRILNPESLSAKETTMAKSLKLKCLTDAHLEEHHLPAEHKGKIGVFDGEELIGIADGPEGWEPKDGNGDGDGNGTEAPQDQFAALSESIHDGKINLVEAGKLADAGRVRFSTILQAQEAERKVNAAVKAGKVLPKNRAHALKLALSDAAAFSALVEQARPVVDLRSHGHAGGGEATTAQQALMAEVNAYAKENKCSVSVALSEVTKRKPDLWREYSEEIVAVSQAAEEEVE
jgi:phage I-like protein